MIAPVNRPIGANVLQCSDVRALGQKRTFSHVRATSALPPIADIDLHGRDGRRKFRPFNSLTVKRTAPPPPHINGLVAFRKMISGVKRTLRGRRLWPQSGHPSTPSDVRFRGKSRHFFNFPRSRDHSFELSAAADRSALIVIVSAEIQGPGLAVS